MGTFTISQTQPGKKLYVYPSGDGCVTDLSPEGQTNNYECVDESKDAYNDDTDYVYSDATDTNRDLYTTDETDWSGLSGAINYIQIYARAKSHLYSQHENGVYKIILTTNPSECTDGVIYESDDKDLTTSYGTFNYVWNTNPSTATSWQWADLNDFEMGVKVSSPTLTDYQVNLTLRPNATGDKEECILNNPSDPLADNYEMVDEANPYLKTNKDTIYNWDGDGGGAAKRDLYNIPNHTTEAGTIISVTVFYVTLGEAGTDPEAQAVIKIGGTEYGEGLHDISNIWSTYAHTWTVNPSTGTAWSWDQIDNLQIGVELKNTTGWIHCTQVYAVVSYYAALNPEIRTTQEYAVIDYDSEVTCTLNKPLEVSVDHDRNIKMLNFWSGNRAVYDIGRNKKSMVITGMEYGSDACTKMECIRGIAEYGGDVTTLGLGGRFDETFKIISFGWKKITDKPLTFEWIIELEYSNLEE